MADLKNITFFGSPLATTDSNGVTFPYEIGGEGITIHDPDLHGPDGTPPANFTRTAGEDVIEYKGFFSETTSAVLPIKLLPTVGAVALQIDLLFTLDDGSNAAFGTGTIVTKVTALGSSFVGSDTVTLANDSSLNGFETDFTAQAAVDGDTNILGITLGKSGTDKTDVTMRVKVTRFDPQ